MLKLFKKLAKLISQQKKKNAPKRTGRLQKSIRERAMMKKDKVVITSSMLDYGYFQDSGVRGSKKPFINGKQPKTFKNKFSRKSNKSLFDPGQFRSKYAGKTAKFEPWRQSVAFYGFRPQPFIKPSVLQVMDRQGYDMIAEATSEDIALEFKNTFKKQ